MKRILAIVLAVTALTLSAQAQEKASIDISSKSPSGMIDPMLYGQLFEHIYFSCHTPLLAEK